MPFERATQATRAFFRTVLRSMTDLRFFREARRRRVSDAIGYLAVLLILTWLIPFSVRFFVGMRSMNDALVLGLHTHVSPDTVFTMKDGVFTTNLEEPIVLKNAGFTLIVNSASSTLALTEDEVGFVVNRDGLIQREDPDRTAITGYSGFPDFEVDRMGINDWIGSFGPWVILLISTVAIFVFSLALAVGFGLFVGAHAFIFHVVMRLLKRPLSFSRAFTIVAFAATVPIILKAVADWSGVDIGATTTYLYWILLAFIAYDLRKEELRGKEKDSPKDHGAPQGQERRG